MSKYKERKQRFFEEIDDLSQMIDLLRKKFLKKPLSIKYDLDDKKAVIDVINADDSILIVTDENFTPGPEKLIMLSGLVDKYFEIDLFVDKEEAPGNFTCTLKAARKATSGRSDLRFKVKEEEVLATNFRVSKHSIDLNMFTLPTGIKVILDQFEVSQKGQYDFFKIGYFKGADPILTKIKKTGKTLWVEDLTKEDSYSPMTDDFIDFKDILGSDLKKYMSKARDKGFKSMMIVPIIYITDSEDTIPFAYIKAISKSLNFNFEDVFKLKENSFKLVDRIREANTITLQAKQNLIDISRGGTRLKIDNDQLKRYLLKAKGFVFDIVFKLQQPITIYGDIKFTGVDENKNLILGLSFSGNTARKNQMKHLYEVLQPMEIDYKKKLIMQMKARQKK